MRRGSHSQQGAPRAELYETDIRDPALEKVFQEFRPEIVDHHAAQSNVPASVADPIYDASVNVLGGQSREYHVVVDRTRLEARGVSLQQVGDAIHGANVIVSPGLINENHQLELALVSGQATSADDLANIVVTNVGNVPVRVGDVANVTPGLEPRFTIVTANGRPAVLINVLRQPKANILTVVDDVKRELARLKPLLPRDVEITPFYDQSILVRGAVSSVRDAILIGLVLSVLILWGFLRDWGTTLVAAMVILSRAPV